MPPFGGKMPPAILRCCRLGLYDTAGMGEPRFSEMRKVRVQVKNLGDCFGYVIDSRIKDGRWIYKLSIPDDEQGNDTFDCWFPEDRLERTK